MQQETTPVLDYTSQRPHVASVAWQSIVAAVAGFVFIPSFMCSCGHLGRDALRATVPCMLLAWWGFARRLSIVGWVVALKRASNTNWRDLDRRCRRSALGRLRLSEDGSVSLGAAFGTAVFARIQGARRLRVLGI